MVTYYEAKNLISSIFCRNTIDEPNDDDLVVDLQRYHRYSISQDQESEEQFVIANSELYDLYQAVCGMNANGLQLYTGRSFEIAIDIDSIIARRMDFPVFSEDTVNCIRYEIGVPSAEYSLYLLLLVKEMMNQQVERYCKNLPMRLRHAFDRYIRYQRNTDEISLTSLLTRVVGELTLKISYLSEEEIKTYQYFCSLKNSFEFEYMYKTGTAIVDYTDISDIFPLDRLSGRRNSVQIDAPPLRKYSEDVVDYYKQALESSDPYIKYLSFYHVIEYFFDEVFKRKMIFDLKNKITHPDFSYKNDDKIYDIAMFVKNRLRMNDETGQGNELESLKYVLTEYVPIDDLVTRIQAIDSNSIQYYQSNKVGFCNAPVIGWSDIQGVYTHLSRRIYFTRNSLVHSKSGKNKERYRPYKDEKKLVLEIPLVKAVAELIIINSSVII